MSPRTYRIVTAKPADFPTIQRIAHATWPHTFGDILSENQIAYMLDMMYSESALKAQIADGHVFHLLLIPDDDPMYPAAGGAYAGARSYRWRAVGYISHQLDYLPGTTKIHKIYLLPGSQGKGYGRQLIARVEKIAGRAGQEKLRLDVNIQNPAVAFYEHLGFVRLGRYDTDIGQGFLMEDWQFEKSLL